MKTPSSDVTFAAIEALKGLDPPRQDPQEDYPLGAWYHAVRLTPLNQFTPGDLARALRQCLYLEYVIPFAVQELKKDALAGDKYDGELLVAMKEVPIDIWRQNQDRSYELRETIQRHLSEFDDDLKQDAGKLLDLLGGRSGG